MGRRIMEPIAQRASFLRNQYLGLLIFQWKLSDGKFVQVNQGLNRNPSHSPNHNQNPSHSQNPSPNHSQNPSLSLNPSQSLSLNPSQSQSLSHNPSQSLSQSRSQVPTMAHRARLAHQDLKDHLDHQAHLVDNTSAGLSWIPCV